MRDYEQRDELPHGTTLRCSLRQTEHRPCGGKGSFLDGRGALGRSRAVLEQGSAESAEPALLVEP
jgi:hypothetical protein